MDKWGIYMEKWFILRKGADFQKIGKKFGISPRLACLIRNRDVISEEEIHNYLYGTIADLLDGMLMKDMDVAVEILCEKIRGGDAIRIIGDYDIDGVNATYILSEAIRRLGGNVDTDIPDRMKDGYGLNRDLIDRALEAEIDTIVTCDNGIAAASEIAYAKEMGLTVIVTDHHEIPFEETAEGRKYHLPPADAVVDPKQEGCPYPFKGLCGAAVAYKLMEAVYNVMAGDADEIDDLMENVAIATVGDVMDLVGENRIFVKQGLEMLRWTKNHGLKALMEVTGVDPETVGTYHIGFVIGPCINAGGRLDTAKRALRLLEASDKRDADILAGELKALNDNRKDMTEKAVELAAAQAEELYPEDRVLVLYLPDCHESLAGIVAGRIRERYHKPVFVLTKAEEGIKGSGRSIETYHMYEEMNRCSELFTKFGGHKLAAGVSMPEENLEKFRSSLNHLCRLTEEDLIEKVSIDMQMPLGAVTESFVNEIELLAPFGKGNRKPLFVEKNLEILEARILGKNKNVLKMYVRDSAGTCLEAMYFGDVEAFYTYVESVYGTVEGARMAFTYYPGINEYRGQKKMQIVVQNYR